MYTHTHTHIGARLNVLLVILIIIVPMMKGWGQEKEEVKPKYFVQIDSHFVKATPYDILYENNREVHLTDNVEWYSNFSVYEYKPLDIDNNGQIAQIQSLKTTIILLSGGAFVKHENQENLNPGSTFLNSAIRLTSKLSNQGYNVFWINYEIDTANKSKIEKLLTNGNCTHTDSTQSRARLEHASLKSFRDFRVKFNQIVSNPNNFVDLNNIFIAGESAGAVLALYSVYLDSSEIPLNISYRNCAGHDSIIVDIPPGHDLRKTGYPIPAVKGIIPMAGGSLYSNIFNNNIAYTNTVAVNLMHGTCDELINQNFERFSYKFLVPNLIYNSNSAVRYPLIFASKSIYTTLIQNHNKIGFGQVINGGHDPFKTEFEANASGGAWDAYRLPYLQPNLPLNKRDIVFENINTFIKRVQGQSGFPAWTNHAYSVFPDIPTNICLQDDLSLINPPIDATNVTCGGSSATATVQPYLPGNGTTSTVTWTVSPNLQIVGSNTGPTITYQSNNTNSGTTGTLTANITYNGKTVAVSRQINIIRPPFPTPVPTPTGYNNVCQFDKTLTLTNLPPSYTITWISSGNISIVGATNQPTVTYSRINNQTGSGVLTATIVTPCETKPFNYTINTLPVGGNLSNAISVVSECESGIVTLNPTKLPVGSTATFSTVFFDVHLTGYTAPQWGFTCGSVISGPTNTLVGNNLHSTITVLATGSTCGDVRVRAQNACGWSNWKIQDTEFGACFGGFALMINPNPASGYIELSLTKDGEKESFENNYELIIVDAMGAPVIKTYYEGSKQQINVSQLRSGQYKAIVNTGEEVVYANFNITR